MDCVLRKAENIAIKKPQNFPLSSPPPPPHLFVRIRWFNGQDKTPFPLYFIPPSPFWVELRMFVAIWQLLRRSFVKPTKYESIFFLKAWKGKLSTINNNHTNFCAALEKNLGAQSTFLFICLNIVLLRICLLYCPLPTVSGLFIGFLSSLSIELY